MNVWNDEKLRYVLQRRVLGRTLQSIGDEFGVGRNHIRMMEKKAKHRGLKP